MSFTTLFIDLDGTLYDNGVGLWQEIAKRINEFLSDLGFSAEEIDRARDDYFHEYGTTLKGLMINHDIDPQAYLDYVHDVPVSKYLKTDGELRNMLSRLPQEKWIFTNADVSHSQRITWALGLDGLFAGVIDMVAMNYGNKPDLEVYKLALEMVEEKDPSQCVLVDDQARNLAPAKEIGFFTVLVGADGAEPAADRKIARVHDLLDGVPELLNA